MGDNLIHQMEGSSNEKKTNVITKNNYSFPTNSAIFKILPIIVHLFVCLFVLFYGPKTFSILFHRTFKTFSRLLPEWQIGMEGRYCVERFAYEYYEK